MPANDRGIGSEGLEQGGPNLGNDYSRKDLGIGNAGDALTTPNTSGLGSRKEEDNDALSMDDESSRTMGSGAGSADVDDDVELDDTDLDEDDDLLDDDEDEDDEIEKDQI